MRLKMKLVFQTRFSYFGQSGWRSTASQSAEALLDPVRLNKRFDLFERVALASLKDQSDPGFELAVLTSNTLPAQFSKRLVELCNDTLGAERCTVWFRRPQKAGSIFRRIMMRRYGNEQYIAQVVLDDDDGVSFDFVEICKQEAEFAVKRNLDNSEGIFLSFPRGLSLGFEHQKAVWLAPRNAVFTNLGLTLVAPASFQRHPFLTSHRQIGVRYSSRVIMSQRPFYVRSVHEGNDSVAKHNEVRLSDEQTTKMFRPFPFLKAVMRGISVVRPNLGRPSQTNRASTA